jgi:transposase
MKSILCFYGINIPDELANSHWSRRFINWIESVRMERASGNLALKVHLSELTHIRQVIAELNRAIRALANTDDYRNNVRRLKTVPGVNTLTAMTLLTELYDISRFKTLDNLCSYVGLILTPVGKRTERPV